MTNNVFTWLQKESKLIVKKNVSDFYDHFASLHRRSKDLFFTNALIKRCKADVLPVFQRKDTASCGIEHAKKVAIDAGTLVLVERQGWDMRQTKKLALLAQIAGLFHDTCSHEPEHAHKSAEHARQTLHGYPLSSREKDIIVFAILNHESPRPEIKREDHSYQIIGNALYDADKFRWGQDTMATTLWEISAHRTCTTQEILTFFGDGIQKLQTIAPTFRTSTGQKYGPLFVQQGLRTASYIHTCIQKMQCTGMAPNGSMAPY